MTTNGDMTSRQPDEEEPLAQMFGELFDLVDETVERITDSEVEDQLSRVLDQSGYGAPAISELPGLDRPSDPGPPGSDDSAVIVEAVRLDPAKIGAVAQLRADTHSEEARSAMRYVADARRQAKQIIADAHHEAEHIISTARDRGALSASRQYGSSAGGVLYVHSAPPALCPHIEWAVAGIVGTPVGLSWFGQPADPGALRAELTWHARPGTAGAIASALAGWNRLRFEVTEDSSPGCDGVRHCYTPDLGLFTAVTGANGDIMVSEDRLRAVVKFALREGMVSLDELDRLLGAAWDNELEPFRRAAEGAPVHWLNADAAG
jgi:hypothetical protein